ncbi:hypothetical protein [Fredinandcohnia onubensis]|uniref:hypothetical protein n=1 Tax=Fredinandcohnia onubensis TaxID=1571209 RepID=UPI000C0BD458|nr:hypothetical protein [Fredinandcohnia onubensis]
MALSHDELVEKREESTLKKSLKLFLKKVLKKVKRDDILILVAKTSDTEIERVIKKLLKKEVDTRNQKCYIRKVASGRWTKFFEN